MNPVEQHLKVLIGDLVIRIAQLSAENDALRALVPAPPIGSPASVGAGDPSAANPGTPPPRVEASA